MSIYDSIFNFLGCAGNKICAASRDISIAWRENETAAEVGNRFSSFVGLLLALVFAALPPGQALQFLLVNLDLPGLFHLLAEIADEQTK